MKLRFRNNSVRLRVNRHEVESLASGMILAERVQFPGGAQLAYTLESSPLSTPEVSFRDGMIRVAAPQAQIASWANSDSIGIYFDLPAHDSELRVAIEKDLECVDGPPEERDPAAFPRPGSGKSC